MNDAAASPVDLPTRLPDSDWRQQRGLDQLCAALGAPADEVRLVGGAVRDGLLGIPVKDIDIATVHAPDEVIARVKAAGFKVVPTGLAHGTVTAILHGHPVEITTLRRDVATDGRRAQVAFGTDWREDAARRDFTMNALYAAPGDGTLFDYFDGQADLAARRVRFIGDPVARIDEDHLRILRYFRFAARFGALDRDSPDYAACVTRAPSLMALSRERIADELLRLLALPDPAPTLRAMIKDAVLRPVLPEVDLSGVQAVGALVAAEQAAQIAPDGQRRLIALLSPTPDGADRIAARLRLSNKLRRRIATALKPFAADTPQALAYHAGRTGAHDQILLGRALTPRALPILAQWEKPQLPISGGDLIAMGLPPGPIVAQTLQAVETTWVDSGFPPRDAVRAVARQLVTSALRSSQ